VFLLPQLAVVRSSRQAVIEQRNEGGQIYHLIKGVHNLYILAPNQFESLIH